MFGQMGVVKSSDKMQAKHLNKGEYCMMVGYGTNHPENTYRVLKIKNNQVITSRDVVWLDIAYGYWKINEYLRQKPPEISFSFPAEPKETITPTDDPNENLNALISIIEQIPTPTSPTNNVSIKDCLPSYPEEITNQGTDLSSSTSVTTSIQEEDDTFVINLNNPVTIEISTNPNTKDKTNNKQHPKTTKKQIPVTK